MTGPVGTLSRRVGTRPSFRHVVTGLRQVAPGFRHLAALRDDDPVRVVVERSGGFAGVVRRGEADASQLDDATTQQLRALVAGASTSTGAAGAQAGPGSRRDGFCYEVTLEDDDVQRVQLREGSMPAGARQLLDGFLR